MCGNRIDLFHHDACEDADGAVPFAELGIRLRVLDLFAGTGSSTQAFVDRGHEVVSVEINPEQTPTVVADLFDLTAADLVERFGPFDFVWASPPCTAFSVGSIGHHWEGDSRGARPRTQAAVDSQRLVAHTVRMLIEIDPAYGWLMENPRGMLRKLPVVRGLPRSTVTYCQYGDVRMKPTDIWGGVCGWLPDRRCERGSSCHEAAPRGSRTGTQGIKGAVDKARVPYLLSHEVADRVEAAAAEQHLARSTRTD